MKKRLRDNFYDKIKPHLRRRIGRELRLAHRVLDLGCGSCDLVRYLAAAYGQDVTGVDISNSSFPARRHTPDGSQYHCLRRDAASMSFAEDGSADAVVSLWALHEMARPKAILQEVHRVLRPGGEVLIVDFPRGSLAQRLWNEAYLRPLEVKTLLQEAGFEELQVRLIEQAQVMWARGYRPPENRAQTE